MKITTSKEWFHNKAILEEGQTISAGHQMKNHPIKTAWEKFKDRELTSFEASTLGTAQPNYYLENRLWRAFTDGWGSCEKSVQKRKRKTK